MRRSIVTLRAGSTALLALTLAAAAAAEDRDPGREPGDNGDARTLLRQCLGLGDEHASKGDRDEHGSKGDRDDLQRLCTVLQQNQGFSLRDQERLRVVLDYSRDNLDLRRHFMTLLADPTPGETVRPSGDGNWLLSVPLTIPCPPPTAANAGCKPQSATETITTLGASMKLAGLYRSVLFDRDRRQKLALYTMAYNHLPEGFTPGKGNALPTPASLSDAPIATIGAALKDLGDAWQIIVQNLPLPTTPPSTASCDGEQGSTPQHDLYGDRTGNSASCTPGATGLFSALSDTQFPARRYLTCVKQQGNRETCHTFAGVSALEAMISQNHGVKANLSEQDLMEHYRLLWSPGAMHETGDAYEELSDAIANNYFFAFENQWEYNPSYSRSFDTTLNMFVNSCNDYPASQPGCSDSAPQAPGFCFPFPILFFALPICDLHDAGVPESPWQATAVTYFWNQSDLELTKEYIILNLAFNNAVVLGFNVTNNFYNGAGPGGYYVYDATDVATNVGGHYVHIVGLATNDELPAGAPAAVGGGYFIIKNSWSNCYGDAGYAYLDWDYVKAVGTAAFSVTSN